MNYLLTPPSTHFDGGLGVTAENFSHSAKVLDDHEKALDNTLPLSYLRRHAIELYLKSFIFILHRKYKIPFEEGFSLENPGFQVNGRWKPLLATHDINSLYGYFEEIFNIVFNKLPPTTNWKIPEEAKKKIQLVGGIDPKSTYFRYPRATNPAQDSKKTKMQSFDIAKAIDDSRKGGKKVKALVMLNNNDEVIDTYDFDADALPEVQDALRKLCELFDGMHAAFRMELCKGS